MPPFFERLDREESVVRGELAALREKAAVLEERLAHLTITRETLMSLRGDERGIGAVAAGSRAPGRSAMVPPTDAGPEGDAAGGPTGPLDLEVARERILVLLTGANQAMKVQDIGEANGENPDRVETTRARLKRLAADGLVTEVSTAWFAIAPVVPQAPRDAEVRGTG